MTIGKRKWGYRRCRFDEGCPAPRPELTPSERVAALLFMRCATQFEFDPSDPINGGPRKLRGVRYEGLRAAWDLMGLDRSPALFAMVQEFEQAAVKAWAGRAAAIVDPGSRSPQKLLGDGNESR
jgi:hypothetical protein